MQNSRITILNVVSHVTTGGKKTNDGKIPHLWGLILWVLNCQFER
jgi:hypothetical protein